MGWGLLRGRAHVLPRPRAPRSRQPLHRTVPAPPCHDDRHPRTPTPPSTFAQIPLYRFVAVFFSAYVAFYALFATAYALQPGGCLEGAHGFAGALWFSVQTASTIGEGLPCV